MTDINWPTRRGDMQSAYHGRNGSNVSNSLNRIDPRQQLSRNPSEKSIQSLQTIPIEYAPGTPSVISLQENSFSVNTSPVTPQRPFVEADWQQEGGYEHTVQPFGIPSPPAAFARRSIQFAPDAAFVTPSPVQMTTRPLPNLPFYDHARRPSEPAAAYDHARRPSETSDYYGHRRRSSANTLNTMQGPLMEKSFFKDADTFEPETFVDASDSYDGDNSPIEIVRSTVSAIDDPSLPTMTIRMWVIATVLSVAVILVDAFMFFSPINFPEPIFVATFLAFIMGKAMEKMLPDVELDFFGHSVRLSPGKFNVKEHALIVITVFTSSTFPAMAALDISFIVFLRKTINPAAMFFMFQSSQFMQLGTAALLYKFLVEPAAMIWPIQLLQVTLFNVLHERKRAFSMSLSRRQLFYIIAGCIAVWQILPTFIAPVLGSIAIVCYLKPSSTMANVLGRSTSGAGFLNLSFDWSQISFLQPLVLPGWAQANFFFGFIGMVWVVGPIAFSTNFLNAKSFPFVSTSQFTANGTRIPLSTLITQDFTLDPAKYEAFGPLFMSPVAIMSLAPTFAAITATISHVAIFYWQDFARIARGNGKADVHTRFARQYPALETWWSISIVVVSFLVSLIITATLGLNPGVVALGMIMATALTFPMSVIQAISGFQLFGPTFWDVVAGFVAQGHVEPILLMRVFGESIAVGTPLYLQNLKLCHYMKVPVRHAFIMLAYATFLTSSISFAVSRIIVNEHLAMLRLNSPATPFTVAPQIGPNFMQPAILFGSIGPQRFFSTRAYMGLPIFLLVGLVAPVPIYILHRMQPKRKWLRVNVPIILLGAAKIFSGAATNTITTALVLFLIFQVYLYKYHQKWWKKYTYVIASALDTGSDASALLVTIIGVVGVKMATWALNNPANPELCPVVPLTS